MSTTRKILQTLQPAANNTQCKLQVSSTGLVKLGKPTATTGSGNSKTFGPHLATKPASQLEQENVPTLFNTKDTKSDLIGLILNVPEAEESSTKSTEDFSIKPQQVEERDAAAAIEPSSTIDDELLKWMTEETPPANYWKELAEERRLALEETLQENEELYETVESLSAKLDSLSQKLEVHDQTIASLNQTIESLDAKLTLQKEEIVTLRVLASEAEKVQLILEELTEGGEIMDG